MKLLNDKGMLFLIVIYLFFPITLVIAVRIPYIKNTALYPAYPSNNTLLINGTCEYCLCISPLSYSALNCFSNNTCQLFLTFPSNYQIQQTPGTRLYFPRQLFPNPSQCCMPNTTYLLNKLKNVSKISVQVPSPRDAVIDNYGYLVTVEANQNQLDRFDPNNLTRIEQISVPSSAQYSITYFQGAYYIAPYYYPMTVISSENLTVLGNISTSISGIRSIIFLNNGRTMVVAACNSNSLGFLTRTNLSSIGYTLAFNQSTTFSCPHGMWRVNDSFFYVTSYYSNSLYSFQATSTSTSWKETFVFQTSITNGIGSATRVTIDECGRFWFAFESDTILIYDQQGNPLGNWTIPNSAIFDIKIMGNYLMYFTDSNNQIMRVDPKIQCPF